MQQIHLHGRQEQSEVYNAVMQQRGLGASSIAGQALIQATMESALPIAQADARTVATFELQKTYLTDNKEPC